MAFLCIAFMGEKKNGDMFIIHHQASLHVTFPPRKQWSEASPNFPHQNKGFINYVFCRNWAVRNPAGTRLDSSLVNKQVAMFRAFFVLKCNACMNSLLNTWNNTRLNTWMRRTFLTLLSRCDCQQRTGQAG